MDAPIFRILVKSMKSKNSNIQKKIQKAPPEQRSGGAFTDMVNDSQPRKGGIYRAKLEDGLTEKERSARRK